MTKLKKSLIFKVFLLLLLVTIAVLPFSGCISKNEPVVENGDTVTIEYTAKYKGGEVFESTEFMGPATFTLGDNSTTDKFNEQLIEMKLGDERDFVLLSQDSYPYDARSVFHYPVDQFEGDNIAVGKIIKLFIDGKVQVGRFIEITDEYAVVDYNIPEDIEIEFHVKVTNIIKKEDIDKAENKNSNSANSGFYY